MWAISHFHHYLYGKAVTVHTDHTAVKAVLETPNPTGKHARWWSRVYGQGVKEVKILYHAGKENRNADALYRSPVFPAPEVGLCEYEVQVSCVRHHWNLVTSNENPSNGFKEQESLHPKLAHKPIIEVQRTARRWTKTQSMMRPH